MRSIVALLILALPSLVAAQAPTAKGHLAVAMDKDQQLFVNTTLDREAVERLSIGDARAALEAFALVDDQRLVELAASVFQVDPEAVLFIWADPNSDYEARGVDRVLLLINRASARIGQGPKPARLFVLPRSFPPGVEMPPSNDQRLIARKTGQPRLAMELTGLIDLRWYYRGGGSPD